MNLTTAVAAVLLALSLWIAILNWRVAWRLHISRVSAPSWTPLLAGVAGLIGLLLLGGAFRRFWWAPLLLDWGSLPGLIHAAVIHVKHSR